MDDSVTNLAVRIRTRDGDKSFKLQPLGLLVGADAPRYADALRLFRHGQAWNSIQRAVRALNAFAQFCLEKGVRPPFEVDSFQNVMIEFYSVVRARPLKESSRAADWNAFTDAVRHLQWKGLFPSCSIPRGFNAEARSEGRLRTRPSYLIAAPPSDAYRISSDADWVLDHFGAMQRAFDAVRASAIDEVKSALADYERGRALIASVDVRNLPVDAEHQVDRNIAMPRPVANDAVVERGGQLILQAEGAEVITHLQAEILRAVLFDGITPSAWSQNAGKSSAAGRTLFRSALANLCNTSNPEYSTLCDELVAHRNRILSHARAQQTLSYFSPSHPNGLANLLAAAHHHSCGVLSYVRGEGSFPGAHHGYAHGSLGALRRLLGLTPETMIAMQVIIVGETGLNIEVVRAIEVDDNGDIVGLTPTDAKGVYEYSGFKARAKSYQRAVLREPLHGEINALSCLRFAAAVSTRMRSHSRLRNLWLYSASPSFSASSFRISDQTWKHEWRLFRKRNKLQLASAGVYHNFYLGDIRVAAGLLAWYHSGGRKVAAANLLGNSVAVAVNNYLPVELQDAVYRRQIRRFHDLLIYSSTRDEDYLQVALNIESRGEFERYLHQLHECFRGAGRYLAESGASEGVPAQPPRGERLIFVYTPRSVALLLALRSHIEQAHLGNPHVSHFEQYVGGCTLQEWIEITNAIERFGEESLDRGFRVVLKRARRIAENTHFSFSIGPTNAT